MAGRKRHVRGRKGNQKKKQKTKRRLWLLFALSVLFLGCILYDCQRKGLLQKEWNKITQPGSTEKPVSTTSGDEQMIRVLLTNDAMNSIYMIRFGSVERRSYLSDKTDRQRCMIRGRPFQCLQIIQRNLRKQSGYPVRRGGYGLNRLRGPERCRRIGEP